MQQWEYCALFGANKSERELVPKWPSLVYFTKMGMETANLATKAKDERPPEWQEASEANYVAHTIAQLGLDGWELVSAFNNTFGTGYGAETAGSMALYFRRPIGNLEDSQWK